MTKKGIYVFMTNGRKKFSLNVFHFSLEEREAVECEIPIIGVRNSY